MTLAISAKAQTLKEQGIDVIGFGAGEPDFATPENIKQAAITAIQNNDTRYTLVGGTNALKDAIIDKFKRDNGLSYERNQIVVSCGAKHSFYNLAQVLWDEGRDHHPRSLLGVVSGYGGSGQCQTGDHRYRSIVRF